MAAGRAPLGGFRWLSELSENAGSFESSLTPVKGALDEWKRCPYDEKHQVSGAPSSPDAGLNREGIQTTKRRGIEKTDDSYVVAYDVEPYHQGTRHYWTICRSHTPDELVSWGYEPTRELAEIAATRELEDLVAGRTQGGQVASTVKAYKHRIASRNY